MHKWKHLETRRLAVQVAQAWNFGFGRLFHKRYRTGIYNTLVYFNGRKTDYFIQDPELIQYNKDLDKLLDNPEFVAGMTSEAKEFVEETYKYVKRLIKDVNNMPDKEMSGLFSKFSYHHANYYTRMWMVFRICERIIIKVEGLLRKSIKDEKKVKELSRIFSIPLIPNDVTNERIDLLRIAVSRNVFNKRKMLVNHTKKYRHIPMYDFDHDPYTIEHFGDELSKIKEPKKELRKILNSFKKREDEFEKKLDELNPKEELRNLIVMLKKAVFVRDYRDMIRQKLNLCIRDFYSEIGKRIGLDVKETALLTNDEIVEHLADSKRFSRIEIESRKKSFLVIQLDDKVEIYSGSKANEKADRLKLFGDVKNVKQLKGTVASKGNAKGVARIVYTNLDLNKIKPGEIMVTPMTRQDFVPYMRKCGAIVTNEGGVTSHPAIISRELGLPCVVGAANATEIINDGDMIMVDGENGEVIKIK